MNLKVILAGEFSWPWYQEACAQALERLGVSVIRFAWLSAFKVHQSGLPEPVYRSLSARFQHRVGDGPTVRRINRDFVELACDEKPDVLWLYNAQLIHAESVRRVRRALPNTLLCQYANDNAFSGGRSWLLWRHHLRCLPLMDLHFCYRHADVAQLVRRGAKSVHLLRSYFIPETDYPVPPESIRPQFRRDAVFAGHYEDDGRVEALEALLDNGISLSLYGGGWNGAIPRLRANSPLRALYPVEPVTGFAYNEAICGAKIALCFLSTLNNDTYTRRCFQIPAMRGMLLSQRTEDLRSLFEEGREAEYFGSEEELVAKTRLLLADYSLRNRIATAGFARVHRDGHSVEGRMKMWLRIVASARKALANA